MWEMLWGVFGVTPCSWHRKKFYAQPRVHCWYHWCKVMCIKSCLKVNSRGVEEFNGSHCHIVWRTCVLWGYQKQSAYLLLQKEDSSCLLSGSTCSSSQWTLLESSYLQAIRWRHKLRYSKKLFFKYFYFFHPYLYLYMVQIISTKNLQSLCKALNNTLIKVYFCILISKFNWDTERPIQHNVNKILFKSSNLETCDAKVS